MNPSPRHRLPTRRSFLSGSCKTAFLAGAMPSVLARAAAASPAIRSINIINFIRAEEPRQPTDLMLPVRNQMELIRSHSLPATWLLQYDALTEGPFVDFLKSQMPATHEPGIWFEMNRRICDDAGIAWRGNPQWEWDYHVPIAYPIGYTPAERRKLADTAMATFRRIFGRDARSIASWNLDAITTAHLSDHYGVDAFANCRDQLATDGFTIWGAPIAAYYPARNNAWSPALDRKNQIATPMFRMLGQDPVYYYDKHFSYPDTMEPAWPSGQDPHFVDAFFHMMADEPAQSFAYAQLGQENSFTWDAKMAQAYPMQMEKLARLRDTKKITVETMGETGRRFKRAFRSTPAQAQVMLEDPFANTETPQRTVWYQSKFMRANLHFRGNEFYLRDLHVYSDHFPQPYLTEPVRQHGIEQRLLAALDGFHWSDDAVQKGREGVRAQGRFAIIAANGAATPLTASGKPVVIETPSSLQTAIRLASGGTLLVTFNEFTIQFRLSGTPQATRLALTFEWVPERSAFTGFSASALHYRFRDFVYSMSFANASASRAASGVTLTAKDRNPLQLILAQKTSPQNP